MQKERKKKTSNVALVESKMDLTFSYRRKMINEGHHSLKKIKEKYPFLFEREQVCINYQVAILVYSLVYSFSRFEIGICKL